MKRKLNVLAVILSFIMGTMFFAGCASQVKTSDNPIIDTPSTASKMYPASEIPTILQNIDFSSEGIEVLDAEAVYVSKEYVEENSYNSIGNYFLGYNAEDLMPMNGEAWFFSVDEGGEIAIDVVNRSDMLANYEASLLPPRQNNTLRNFLIGGGVILVTATLSVLGSPAVACIALGAMKGAVVGATIGSAVYAATSAISYRVSEGTWEGSSEVILESASQGFMIGSIVGAATGALTSANCFVAGTPILLPNGESLPIEEIQVGTQVVCANEAAPYTTYSSTVMDVFSRTVNETYVVEYDAGNTIETTAEHPFFVSGQGWVETANLTAGNELITDRGSTVIVESVTKVVHDDPIAVYNFEVEDEHTYYVGVYGSDEFVLVHNSCAHTQAEWTKERASHWKQSGEFYQQNYSLYKNQLSQSGTYIVNETNVQRMMAGKAPLDASGISVQLHHTQGIMTNMYDYIEITRAEHYANYRALHWWLFE